MSARANQALEHKGACEFFKLLHNLLQVPPVLLPGKTYGQDDAMAYGLHEAHSLTAAAIKEAGFTVADPAQASGFVAGLSWMLMCELNGVSPGLWEVEEDASYVLSDLALAKAGRHLNAGDTAVQVAAAALPKRTVCDCDEGIEGGVS